MLRIHATVEFLPASAGGRETPVQSGYRGLLHVGGRYATGSFQFLENRWVQPGESVRADIAIPSDTDFVDRLPADGRFEITEGRRVVGRGCIIGDATSAPSNEAAQRLHR